MAQIVNLYFAASYLFLVALPFKVYGERVGFECTSFMPCRGGANNATEVLAAAGWPTKGFVGDVTTASMSWGNLLVFFPPVIAVLFAWSAVSVARRWGGRSRWPRRVTFTIFSVVIVAWLAVIYVMLTPFGQGVHNAILD